MRIACLISGLPRSFQYNIDRMINAFEGKDIDYFLHVTKEYNDQYNNKKGNYDEIIRKLNPVQTLIERDLKTEANRFSNIRKQWYKINVVNNLKINYEKNMGIKYDIVIRIRPDLIILDEKINFKKCNNIIYGNNDEFFYTNSNIMDQICNLIFEFDKNSKNARKSNDIFFNYLRQKGLSIKNTEINYKIMLTECNIIAISGDSGCGKTTLVNVLDRIFKNKSLKIEGDRYHKWERGDKNWNSYTHLNPNANYICKFKEDTFKLKIGENIYQVDYDHSTGKFTEQQELKSNSNVLMCGLHTLYDDSANKLFNLKIFLDTDKNLKYYWKIKRDTVKRGYTIDKVLEKIKQRENDHNLFIKPQKKNSDIIIRFFTDEDFNYMELDKLPNIYLKISSKESIIEFVKKIDDYKIDYNLSKGGDWNSIIFYKISCNFKSVLFEYINSEMNSSENDYYTIILAFILFNNI